MNPLSTVVEPIHGVNATPDSISGLEHGYLHSPAMQGSRRRKPGDTRTNNNYFKTCRRS